MPQKNPKARESRTRVSAPDDGGEVTLGRCVWETIHNDSLTSIRVHLKEGNAEMEVNGDRAPLSRCNWIRASGRVRVHGTGGYPDGKVEWKPV